MGAKGLIPNYSKRETVPCLRSHQANRDFSAEFKMGKARARARYLGCRYAWNLSSMEEFRYRCAAVHAGWGKLGKFWTSRASKSLKILAFRGHVVEAALSANEPFAFPRAQTQQLDGILAKCLRVLERGKAADWSGEHPHSSSNSTLRQ
eukprot:3275066-Pyramimonas_sp.AAC.1